MTEKQIENSILEALNSIPQIWAYKVNNGGQFDPTTKRWRSKSKWDINGKPDIMVHCYNRTVYMEVKTQKGRQSPSQKEFERRCKCLNIEYYVVRNVDEAMNIVDL